MNDFQLVDPQFLTDHLSEADSDPPCILLEAHFTSIDHPSLPDPSPARHIPGAVQVHPSYLEAGTDRSKYYPHYHCPADGNLLPDAALILALRRLGLTPDTLVIVYGSEPDGTMAAARLVWALLYAGIHQVRLLDGGLDSWLSQGRPTSSFPPGTKSKKLRRRILRLVLARGERNRPRQRADPPDRPLSRPSADPILGSSRPARSGSSAHP